MTLVKSLYSGDPDVIQNTWTCKCLMYIQGATLARAIRPTSQFMSPYAWHMQDKLSRWLFSRVLASHAGGPGSNPGRDMSVLGPPD